MIAAFDTAPYQRGSRVSAPRREWPMETYLTAWKTFRRLSDENVATARCIVASTGWPKTDGITVVDVGCGDGRLVEEVALRSPSAINEIRLVDPDAELLAEAAACVGELALVPRIDTIHRGLEDFDASVASDANVILCVHVVYLLEPATVRTWLETLPVGVPAYIVLDAPSSVFTTLWARTAPRYHKRVADAHALVAGLPADRFLVGVSSIQSTVCNPLVLRRADVRDALLSLLCYTEISSATDNDLRRWIEDTLHERVTGDAVRCESTCYEVVRVGAS